MGLSLTSCDHYLQIKYIFVNDKCPDRDFLSHFKNVDVEKEVVVVHRGSYNDNKCIIVCLTM